MGQIGSIASPKNVSGNALQPNIMIRKLLILISIYSFFSSCSGNDEKNVVLIFEHGNGLFEGELITLNGFDVGKVESIELSPQYEVCATVLLKNDINIPSDSKFVLDNKSLLSSQLEIIPGESEKLIQNNDTINAYITSDYQGQGAIEELGKSLSNFGPLKHQDSILIELRRLNSNLEKYDSIKDTMELK